MLLSINTPWGGEVPGGGGSYFWWERFPKKNKWLQREGKSPACRGDSLCHPVGHCQDSDQSIGSSKWAGICPDAEDGHEKQLKALGLPRCAWAAVCSQHSGQHPSACQGHQGSQDGGIGTRWHPGLTCLSSSIRASVCVGQPHVR